MKHFLRPLLILVLMSLTVNGQERAVEKFNTRGLDLELLSYGGSLGAFYNIHPREDWSIDFESDWTLVESNDTYTYYNYYNQPVSINNKNLSFVKALAGSTWYPFLDTMHPSFQFGTFASVGPLLSLNTADDQKFLERWQDVDVKASVLFRAGVHIRVLSGQGSAYNFRVGYDHVRFDEIVDGKQIYKGLLFQAAWEFVQP